MSTCDEMLTLFSAKNSFVLKNSEITLKQHNSENIRQPHKEKQRG